MKRQWFLQIFLGIILIIAIFSTTSASSGEYLVFSQRMGAEEQLYVVNGDGSDLQTVCSGKDFTVFFLGNFLLYFQDHHLYNYDFTTRSSQSIYQFKENQIDLQTVKADPGSSNQILVITPIYQNAVFTSEYWFILDGVDGSLRKISMPKVTKSPKDTLRHYSPDRSFRAQIRKGYNNRFDLEIQSVEGSKQENKTLWTLPKKMTVIPEAPVWSPNSDMLAFYGKEFLNTPAGFYTLFIYDSKQQQLLTIQEQVFNIGISPRLRMGEFTPDWSGDGRYLILEYQPFGLPTQSSILKYEAGTGKKTFLADGHGAKGYPLWSPSGQTILFLSRQNGEEAQVYTMDAQGENLIRISPQEGFTQWAGWYEPNKE